MPVISEALNWHQVALRKESVDRNTKKSVGYSAVRLSLSARRAWIEILAYPDMIICTNVALRKESVDRNAENPMISIDKIRRSPQGERG